MEEPAAAAEAFEEAFIEVEEPQLITSSTMHAQRPGPKSYVFAPPPRHHRAVDPACGAPGTHPSRSVSKSAAKKPQPVSAADETPEYQRFSSLIPT